LIKKIYERVTEAISSAGPAGADTMERDAALRMATATLMIDVARADSVFDESEFDTLLELIASHFALPAEQAAELVIAANEKADDMVSVHEFTQLLHENLSENEKARIVALLWKIAYADGRLDKYEDSLVLKISDLLYVSRGRVMRLKHDAEQGVN
jgi:uncharacterized tellurite resistance protein B-like protein